MTKQIEEALKMAIEALEFIKDGGFYTGIDDCIQACKAALALSEKQHTFSDKKQSEQEVKCNPHPDAPHGFMRDESHSQDRYVCECEYWTPPAQEPVAWMDSLGYVMSDRRKIETQGGVGDAYTIPLYTHPAQEPINLKCKSVQKRLATQWGYVKQYAQEPVLVNATTHDGQTYKIEVSVKEWQGLSNDMVRAIGEKCQEENRGILNWIDFYSAIESMLKDKNYE